MEDACLLKFRQNQAAREYLLSTGSKILAYADAQDHRWGIGVSEEEVDGLSSSDWPGNNMLGKVLTWVREELQAQREMNVPEWQYNPRQIKAPGVSGVPIPDAPVLEAQQPRVPEIKPPRDVVWIRDIRIEAEDHTLETMPENVVCTIVYPTWEGPTSHK
jgi:hypothetical protein